jgi:hypothetical protein
VVALKPRNEGSEAERAAAGDLASDPADMQTDAPPVSERHYHDSPATKRLGEGKKFHWQRYKGAPRVESWTNAKAGYVGFLTGRGYMSPEIEKILADGTSRETVRGLWRRWGLPIPQTGGRRCAIVPVAMTTETRRKLSIRAKKVGVTPDEWIRRILISAIDDDLYAAVTDGRFDKKLPPSEGRKTVIVDGSIG